MLRSVDSRKLNRRQRKASISILRAYLDPRLRIQEKILRKGGSPLVHYTEKFNEFYQFYCRQSSSVFPFLQEGHYCRDFFLILPVQGDLRSNIDRFLECYENKWRHDVSNLKILVLGKNALQEDASFLRSLQPHLPNLQGDKYLGFYLIIALALRNTQVDSKNEALHQIWSWLRNGPYVRGSNTQNLSLDKIEEKFLRGFENYNLGQVEKYPGPGHLEFLRIPYLPYIDLTQMDPIAHD